MADVEGCPAKNWNFGGHCFPHSPFGVQGNNVGRKARPAFHAGGQA